MAEFQLEFSSPGKRPEYKIVKTSTEPNGPNSQKKVENFPPNKNVAKMCKRPKSSYMQFVQQNYARTRSEMYGKNCTYGNTYPTIKKLAALWRTLSIEEKAPYEKQAIEDRGRYYNLKVRALDLGPEVAFQFRRRHQKRRPLAPLRPCNAFFLYQKDQAPVLKIARPSMSQQEIVRQLSKQWQKLPADMKQPYLDQYRREKATFKSEKGAFRKETLTRDIEMRAQKLFDQKPVKKRLEQR